MTDWGTVAIAAISGAAGVSASVLQNVVTWKSQSRSQRNGDVIVLRQKIEDFFTAIDVLEDRTNRATIAAIQAFSRVEDEIPVTENINLGSIRAAVHLYFPDCVAAITNYDRGAGDRAAKINSAQGASPGLLLGHLMMHYEALRVLAVELRTLVEPLAQRAGASIRHATLTVE